MRDATNIKNLKFEVSGHPAKASDVWLSQNGEYFVSLNYNNIWLNVRIDDLKKYIKEK